jgi:hypothetical protein
MGTKTLILFCCLCLVACSDHYRYPCQDPKNWNKEECNNKVCDIEGTCTEKLIKK